jgi:hypothetical protein
MSTSVLVPNITRDLICTERLNEVIVSLKNKSSFKVGTAISLRSSNGSKPHVKIFNDLVEQGGYFPALEEDEHGNFFTIVTAVRKFQVSVYSREEKKFDIYIDDLYLSSKEQEDFLKKQGMSVDEFLDLYGKEKSFYGYLLKFDL